MDNEQPVIPADPALGASVAIYPTNRLRVLVIGTIIGAPIAVFFGLGIAPLETWWALPVTLVGMALATLVLGWYILHLWYREIILYRRGFSFREGSSVIFFAYDEIKWVGLQAQRLAYLGGLVRRDVYRIEVHTYAGDKMTITNAYRRPAELGTRITENVDRVLRPVVNKKLAAGEKVDFGAELSLSNEGIITETMPIAWEDFMGYTLGGGKLTLQTRSAHTVDLALGMIYNIALFIDLLKEKRAEVRPRE